MAAVQSGLGQEFASRVRQTLAGPRIILLSSSRNIKRDMNRDINRHLIRYMGPFGPMGPYGPKWAHISYKISINIPIHIPIKSRSL